MTVLLVRLCMLLNKYFVMSNSRWSQLMIPLQQRLKQSLSRVFLMIWNTPLMIILQKHYQALVMALLGLRLSISAVLGLLRDRTRNIVSILTDVWVCARLCAVRLGQSLGLMQTPRQAKYQDFIRTQVMPSHNTISQLTKAFITVLPALTVILVAVVSYVTLIRLTST